MLDSDHDLLVRIDEQVKQLWISFSSERTAAATRATKQDSDFEVYKRDTAKRIEDVENEVGDLRTSRAQFYAIAATISFAIGVLIKVFWK